MTTAPFAPTTDTTDIVLDFHNCQTGAVVRTTWSASPMGPCDAHAAAYVLARRHTHAITEVAIPDNCPALMDALYPVCEHGLSARLCAGPGHYPADY